MVREEINAKIYMYIELMAKIYVLCIEFLSGLRTAPLSIEREQCEIRANNSVRYDWFCEMYANRFDIKTVLSY